MNKLPLSVVMIGPSAYRAGDTSHSTFSIWRELAKGFNRFLVIARAQGSAASWSKDDVSVRLIPGLRRRELEFFFTQFLTIPIACKFRPDVIVAQGPPLGGLAAIAIAKLTGANTLIEIHGAEYVVPASLWSRNGILQLCSAAVLRRATRIRVLTERMRQCVIDRYGEHLRDRIVVLPPRVNVSKFRAAVRETPQGKLIVAMVGAINQNKGQLRLAQILAEADLPVELHLAGDGPLRPDCEALAESLTGNFGLIVHGQLTPDAVADLLDLANLLIMYSKSEGTPRAIIEAMATGLPIITTCAGFCADIVGADEGFVLGNDPDKEVIQVLRMLLSDPGLITEMGVKARARAMREFDADKLYPQYRALIADTAIQ